MSAFFQNELARLQVMLQQFLQVFFPSTCVSCGYLEQSLCLNCADHLNFSPHVRDLDGLTVYSGFNYEPDSVLADLIHAFKYKHGFNLARLLQPYMIKTLVLFVQNPQDWLLCPVPLFKARLHERGYNQSEKLARPMGRLLGMDLYLNLVRGKDTGSQAKVATREDRQRNMEGAFSVRGSGVRGRRILLVDDVVTTGSTLLACQKVLLEAGAAEVTALTLADRVSLPAIEAPMLNSP